MNKLVIVESPNKVKSIGAYIKELQKEGKLDKKDKYEIESSVGHIMELKKSWEPKIENEILSFEKVVIRGKAKVVNGLKAKAKKADIVLIATDPDREGEAIADDLIKKLEAENKYQRITFNEITKDSIELAFNNPLTLDQKMVNAQKTRMVLDRIFGYKLSKWIQNKLWNARARSAGRVQSPTLKLVVEREFLIEGFKPEEYFKVEQIINKTLVAPIFLNQDMVDNKTNQLNPKKYADYREKLKGELKVKEIKTSQSKGRIRTPFKQSAVYRAASSALGISAANARAAMQALFEKGFITYPRTDSTRYSQSFINKAHKYIENKFGKEYVANVKGTKSGSQDAHEALRITDPNNTPDKISAKLSRQTEINMYKIIYNNTLQSLMVPPIRESLSYLLEDNGINFKLSSSKVIYDGYLKLTGWDKGQELPIYKKGDIIKSDKIDFIEGETKPKARFNEGSLIEAMEEEGIGRPSTFSSTVSTLISREYIEKNGNALRATRTGKAVAAILMLYFGNIIKEEYTMELEKTLDQIAEGNKKLEDVLKSFYLKLSSELNSAVIKRKESIDDKTAYISLKDIEKEEKKFSTPNKNKNIEDMGAYTQEYTKLIIDLISYAKIDKKDINIDYKSFVKNEFEKYLGPIVMPQPPKRGRYILSNDNELSTFRKAKKYTDTEICHVCQKNPMVYQGGISKRNQLYWMKTCSGWPEVKCNNTSFIDKDDSLFEKLEKYYDQKVRGFKDEEVKHINDLTQEIKVPDETIQILIKGL